MFAQDLEAAIGPTVALPLVGFERIRQQPMTVAAIGVVDLPAMLEHSQAEVAILDNGIARPATHREERGAANEAHGAVHDNGIRLVTLDHADIEEAGVLAVHGV